MRATTLTVLCRGSRGLSRFRGLTGHLRNHRLILLRGLHLLQLGQKLFGGRKTKHISLLLDRGS